MADSSAGRGYLALDEYSKFVPPGWEPHLSWYPLKSYEQNLELWGHLIVNQETGDTPPMSTIGPLIYGRLKGAAKRLALNMTITFPDTPNVPLGMQGTVIQGTNAIVFPGIAADPATNSPAMLSGLQTLLQVLKHAYGRDLQDLSGEALDRFDECVRGGGSLMDYITAFKIRYETAEEKAGLQVNDICNTHRFLKGAGLAK